MPQTLLTPSTNEIILNTASGGAWASGTPRRVSRTGVDGNTPGGIGNYIGIVEPSSPTLIVIIGTAPPCDLILIQDVGHIR